MVRKSGSYVKTKRRLIRWYRDEVNQCWYVTYLRFYKNAAGEYTVVEVQVFRTPILTKESDYVGFKRAVYPSPKVYSRWELLSLCDAFELMEGK